MMQGCWILVVVSLVLLKVKGNDDIRLPPSITIGPKGHFLYDPQRKTGTLLQCLANGFPQPEGDDYVWIKNGETLDLNVHRNIKRDSDPTKGTLTLNPTYQKDEGYYQCIVSNAYGTAVSDVLFLQAAFMANYTESYTKDYFAKEGQPLKLTCNNLKSVPRATYSWWVNSGGSGNDIPVKLSRRVNIDDSGNLHFSHTTPIDASNNDLYMCAVQNDFLRVSKRGSFSRIYISRPGPADLIEPSIVYKSTSPKIALIDEDIRLQCLFSGNPEAEVTWSRVGGSLPDGRYDYGRAGTELILQRIEWGDEATYRCEGKSVAGNATDDIVIHVEAKPVFKMIDRRPHNINATDNDDVIFLCNVTAKPEAEIKWYINGTEFSEEKNGRMQLSADRKKLSVAKVCKSCLHGSDLMNIQCNASNIHGYVYSQGYLNVLNPTNITLPPKSYEHVHGEDIVFHCEAVSDVSTPVHINWYLGGRKIVEEPGRIEIDGNSTLRINTQDESDGGMSFTSEVKCEATNGYSSDQATAQLFRPASSDARISSCANYVIVLSLLRSTLLGI